MAISAEVREALAAKFAVMLPHLDERQRRLYLGSEARALGHGGIAAVARAAGVAELTVSAGVAELEAGAEPLGRARRAGGGRKKAEEKDPGLIPALEALLEDSTRGDPVSPLKWTTKSAGNLAGELAWQGHPCRPDTVLRLLHGRGYSTQGNAMTIEGRRHPDRDAQFRYISGMAGEFLAAGDPVVSVDAKKREQVGQYAQAGREWRPKGDPVRVRDHDFPDRGGPGKVTPYGVYDIGANAGFVNVGTDRDTAAFAVESLRRWWRAGGQGRYPAARRLLVTADAGGSNGYRTRAWKAGLATLAAETGLEITVLHFPPGTSKWNKIEHRLFCQITRNWRARPLTSHQVILETIAAVTTRTGLRVEAMLDAGTYPTGIKISDEQMKELEERVLDRHAFHGEWNYTVLPVPRSAAPVTRPAPARPAPAGRCGQPALNHPALTGMDPADLTALAAALQVPFGARREQRLFQHRGGPRRGSGRAGGHNRKLDLTDHLLAARMRQHLNLPPAVIGALLGADGTTISHATSRIAPLLAAQPAQPAAPAPGIRLRTLDDLREYAAAAGITLTITGQPPRTPRPRTKQATPSPDTPKLKTDASLSARSLQRRRSMTWTVAGEMTRRVVPSCHWNRKGIGSLIRRSCWS
jgi:Rhodopirellula transposase DDE domain